jgi:hypothetical protein
MLPLPLEDNFGIILSEVPLTQTGVINYWVTFVVFTIKLKAIEPFCYAKHPHSISFPYFILQKISNTVHNTVHTFISILLSLVNKIKVEN